MWHTSIFFLFLETIKMFHGLGLNSSYFLNFIMPMYCKKEFDVRRDEFAETLRGAKIIFISTKIYYKSSEKMINYDFL